MKRSLFFSILLAVGISACEPVPTPDMWLYVAAKTEMGGQVVTELNFDADGGTQTVYVETTLPIWFAWPLSLGPVFVHPQPGDPEFTDGYITLDNDPGWMTVRFKHMVLGLFNGVVEVTCQPNDTGVDRSDVIYLWNDDIPAWHTSAVLVTVSQSAD